MLKRFSNTMRKMCASILIVCMCIGMIFVSPQVSYAATQMIPIEVTYGQSEARGMLQLINSFRTDANQAWAYDSNNNREMYSGLGNLQYDYELEQIAMKRAAEVALTFSHTRPNGRGCFSVYPSINGAVAENIAAGQSSAERVFTAWKEENEDYSGQGHRRNMLGNYAAIGIGHVKYAGTHYWVQVFRSYCSNMSDLGANDGNSVVNVETDDSYIRAISATKSNISLKKGESSDLSDLGIAVSISQHFGGVCKTLSTYDVSVADTGIAAYDNGKLVGVQAGETKLILTAFGKQCEVTVSVTEEKQPQQEPDGDKTNQNQNNQTETDENQKPVEDIPKEENPKEEAPAEEKRIVVVTQPQDVHGVIGTKANLQVEADGTGLTYQWRYSIDGQVSDEDYYYYARNSRFLSLMITKTTAKATYWCHISDQFGNEVNTVPCRIACDIKDGYAASGICGTDIEWTLDANGAMTVNGSGALRTEDISWYDYKDDIKSVVFHGTITEIGDGAFYQASELRSVDFPASLIKIGEEAFYETRLSDIVFPNGLKEIGDSAFAKLFIMNSDKSNIVLPDGLIKIGSHAFYRSEFNSIYVPSSVTEFGYDAFMFVRLIRCEADSCAEAYAKGNKYNYTVEKKQTDSEDGKNEEQENPKDQTKPDTNGGTQDTVKPDTNGDTQNSGKPDTNGGTQDTVKPDTSGDTQESGTTNPNAGSQETGKTDSEQKFDDSLEKPEADTDRKTQKLEITASSRKIASGKNVQLNIEAKMGNIKNQDVIWKSGNTKYATVNTKGVVTTRKAGAGKTVTITAIAKEDNSVAAVITIKIMQNAVTKVKVKNSPKAISAGKSVTLKAVVTANGKSANKKLKWTSSNAAYAVVNQYGKVVAKKSGKGKTVTITAEATDGTNQKASVKMKIK